MVSRWAKHLFGVPLKLSAGRAAAHLCGETDPASRLLGEALQETLQNQITSQEKAWVDRIEALRKELSVSTTPVAFVDYGAGRPSLKLTAESMYSGRGVTRTIGDVCRGSSKPYFWSLLLFKLVRKFKPVDCVELGTCLGISASFQAAALELNEAGHIVTLEGAAALASLAEGHFQRLGLDNVRVATGRFQDTLDEVLNAQKPIDYIFIDGHHDEKATIAYFEQTMPFLAERAILVFDDISWSAGMKRAWKTIAADARVKLSLNLRHMGVGIVDSRLGDKKNLTIPLVSD